MSRKMGVPVVLLMGVLDSQSGRAAAGSGKGLEVTATVEGKLVRVSVAGKTFTCYKFAPDQKYPYFYPINGPVTGKSVTTESSQPYPHHHSLFFGCDKVSGGNYWQAANVTGQIISKGPKIVEAKGQRVVIEDRTRWRRRGAPEPFSGQRTIVITAPSPTLRIIDFAITLTAETDVHIARSNHALFSGRMSPHMSVNSGGRLINAEGGLKQKGTLAKKSAWCDYSGNNGGRIEGMAILDWPQNRWWPCTWLTRDYGFFSPTPMNWLDKEGLRFAKGESITLKYRVVVHAGNEKDADVAAIYKAWAGTAARDADRGPVVGRASE